MNTRNGFLFLFLFFSCLLVGTLSASSARAAQMSITAFPEKLIVSATDNRIIAFIVEKDGVRVPQAQVKAAITSGEGKLDMASCQTDESGQCLFSYTAPKALGSGAIEATASMDGASDGKAVVAVDVVETPSLSGSGWQCEGSSAVYATIQETISCSDACSLKKDCAQSKCPAGGNIYCHSAQEACNCGGIEEVKGARTKANTERDDSGISPENRRPEGTPPAAPTDSTASSIATGALLVAMTSLIYMVARKQDEKQKGKKDKQA